VSERVTGLLLLSLLLALPGAAENFVWIDEAGVTHITNDPARVPEPVRERSHDPESLRSLWEGPVDRAAKRPASAARDRDEERTRRTLQSAVYDLQRGENARAAAVLRSILREQPGRPEPHWYLAQLDRYRGRYDSSAQHLQAFLATAGDELEPWRATARTRLAALADERRLAERTHSVRGPWPELASPNFRVELDPDLGRAAPDYANTVLRYLEEARVSVANRLGAKPDEAMGVVFYGRAAYDQAHRERFSFRTVGFFDGRIHVVSAAHPAGELRALLFHEYTHAVFRERTGGDQPYWLNEGLAELSEREARGQPGLTRSERAQLKRRIDAGEWISLRRLAPSFGGLEDDDARIAYLESTAAADWLGARTDRTLRGRLIERIGAGAPTDQALSELLHMDTGAVDAAVREWIGSEFAGRLPRPADLEE
jgi:tetratricopeptide (TPR) repeat protein